MTMIHDMLETHPVGLGNVDRTLLEDAIQACLECSQACTACADACLAEEMVADLARCIRSDLDCAEICDITGRILSRRTGYDVTLTRAVLQACATACKSCGDECASHAEMHAHCRVCADACRRCEQACRALLDSLG